MSLLFCPYSIELCVILTARGCNAPVEAGMMGKYRP